MAEIILRGYVQEDGRVIIEDKVDLPPGEIRLVVQPRRTPSITLAEAKQLMKEGDTRTPEQIEAARRIHEELGKGEDNLGLPPDYADEIDHYLHGTPKRNQADKE